MRIHLVLSAASAVLTALAYPFLEHLADLERGYDSAVIDGEEMVAFFGIIVVPVLLLSHGYEKLRNRREAATEQGGG
jgi:predicted outer membrane lipoprotein